MRLDEINKFEGETKERRDTCITGQEDMVFSELGWAPGAMVA